MSIYAKHKLLGKNKNLLKDKNVQQEGKMTKYCSNSAGQAEPLGILVGDVFGQCPSPY